MSESTSGMSERSKSEYLAVARAHYRDARGRFKITLVLLRILSLGAASLTGPRAEEGSKRPTSNAQHPTSNGEK